MRVGDGGFFRGAPCCEGSEARVFAFWDWRATLTRVGLLAPWARCEVAVTIYAPVSIEPGRGLRAVAGRIARTDLLAVLGAITGVVLVVDGHALEARFQSASSHGCW